MSRIIHASRCIFFILKIHHLNADISLCLLCSKLTNGYPNSQSGSHKTTRWRATDFGGSMNQLRDLLEDAAQSTQVVNTAEATACKRDVPLLSPVKHLPWLGNQLQTDWFTCCVRFRSVFVDHHSSIFWGKVGRASGSYDMLWIAQLGSDVISFKIENRSYFL